MNNLWGETLVVRLALDLCLLVLSLLVAMEAGQVSLNVTLEKRPSEECVWPPGPMYDPLAQLGALEGRPCEHHSGSLSMRSVETRDFLVIGEESLPTKASIFSIVSACWNLR